MFCYKKYTATSELKSNLSEAVVADVNKLPVAWPGLELSDAPATVTANISPAECRIYNVIVLSILDSDQRSNMITYDEQQQQQKQHLFMALCPGLPG